MNPFPKNQIEFEKRFSNESLCIEYLARLRWPDGPLCPKCKGNEVRRKSRSRLYCKSCEYEFTVTVGTIFEKSHIEIGLWLRAAWWLTNQKHGMSALSIQRTFGIGSYQTAWLLAHKLRAAMVTADRTKLSGEVEVDEVFLSGSKKRGRGAGSGKGQIIVIAVELREGKTGRVRIKRVPDTGSYYLCGFVEKNVMKASKIITDGWQAYNDLKKRGFMHVPQTSRFKRPPTEDDDVTPNVHRVASLLKRGIQGVHHGSISSRYLDQYLEEFTFRYNRRTSSSRGLLFYRLIQNCINTAPMSKPELLKKYNLLGVGE